MCIRDRFTNNNFYFDSGTDSNPNPNPNPNPDTCTEEEANPLEEGVNPLHPATGNVRRTIPDLSGSGAPEWQRYHNSIPHFPKVRLPSGVFGGGGNWRHNWQYDLVLDRNKNTLPDFQFVYPSGKRVGLKPDARGTYAAIYGGPERAQMLPSGLIDFTAADGSLIRFIPIQTIRSHTFYAPVTLTLPGERVYTFERGGDGRLLRLIDPEGRWLKFVYRDVVKDAGPWQVAATLSVVPAAGQWSEITLPAGLRLESTQLSLHVLKGAALAEVQFFAEGLAAPLAGGPAPLGAAAFDGNPATVATEREVFSASLPEPGIRPTKVRFLSAPGKEAALLGLTFNLRLVQHPTETQAVLARVETSDGRATDYDYAVSAQSKKEHVILSAARYGDGTVARYDYSKQTDQFGDKALLVSADDPRYPGPAKKIRYDYYQPARDKQPPGTIKAEINPTTGHAWAKLELDAAEPLKRIVSYSDDRFHVYQLVDEKSKSVAARTDSLGRTNRFEYAQGGGQPSTQMDYSGRRLETQRDNHGRVLSSRDKKGRTKTHQRDAQGRLTQTTDSYGRVTKIDRDSVGRIQRVTKPTGQVHKFTHDSAGRVIAYTGTKGRVTATYDAQGRRISFTDALGNSLYATRDTHGRVIAVNDSLGRVTRHEYNERGLVTKTTTPDNQNRTFSYDNYGRKVAETDTAGRTATFAYDDLSRITKQVGFDGRVTTYEFSEFPGGCGTCTISQQPTRIVGPDGVATTFLYDAEGRVLARTVASGTEAAATTTYDYDLDDNLVATTDPLGRTTRSTYDDDKHRLTSTDPLGRVTRWVYDEQGNITSITAPDGAVTRHQYDVANRLIATTDAANQTTRIGYDVAGRVIKTTNAAGEATIFGYDATGQKTSALYADGKRQTWTYDVAGRVSSTVSTEGVASSTSYDSGDRPLTVTRTVPGSPAETTTFTYDALGHRLSMADALGRTTRWTYDARGNVLTLTRPDGHIGTRNTYDAQVSLLTTTAPRAARLTTATPRATRFTCFASTPRVFETRRHRRPMRTPRHRRRRERLDARRIFAPLDRRRIPRPPATRHRTPPPRRPIPGSEDP